MQSVKVLLVLISHLCVYLSNEILKDLELENYTLLLFIELEMCITNRFLRE